jgi:hypothetical protein
MRRVLVGLFENLIQASKLCNRPLVLLIFAVEQLVILAPVVNLIDPSSANSSFSKLQRSRRSQFSFRQLPSYRPNSEATSPEKLANRK